MTNVYPVNMLAPKIISEDSISVSNASISTYQSQETLKTTINQKPTLKRQGGCMISQAQIDNAIAVINSHRVERYTGKITFAECMIEACGYDKELRKAVGQYFGSRPKKAKKAPKINLTWEQQTLFDVSKYDKGGNVLHTGKGVRH